MALFICLKLSKSKNNCQKVLKQCKKVVKYNYRKANSCSIGKKMITVELQVGDVLMGKHYGDLQVMGFQDEKTINGIEKIVVLKDINYNKGNLYYEPLNRIMHSQYDVVRGHEFYPAKEV